MKTKITFLSIFLLISLFTEAQAPLYSGVPVSTTGTDNSIGTASTSRNVAVDNAGSIYAVFSGSNGIRVAKSTNRGQSFLSPVLVSSNSTIYVEIAASSNGTIYVLWGSGFAYSSDGGSTFTTSSSFFGAGNSANHIATNGSNVYILNQSGSTVYSNSTNGVGTFTTTSLGLGNVYSDLFVDSTDGTVYLVGDTPNITLFQSVDNAVSFNQIMLSQPIEIYYSSYTYSKGSLGKFIFVGGSGGFGGTSGTDGYRINLANGNVTPTTLMNNDPAEGRTLVADEFGNFVDGYTTGSSLDFRISYDQGATWQPAITGVTGTSQNLARNQVFQDVVVLYSQSGQIYCNVYGGILPGLALGITQVRASQCGVTLDSYSTIVYADNVPSAQAYRFRVTNLSDNSVVEQDYVLRNLYMRSLSNFAFNTAYTVEVAVKRAGIWEAYGASCTITTATATTQLRSSDCATYYFQRNNNVYADIVPLAQGYRFYVNNLSTGSTQLIDRALRVLPLSQITDYNPLASASRGGVAGPNTYYIQVAVKNTDGTYLPYGSACTIEIGSGMPSSTSRVIDENNIDTFKVAAYPNPFTSSFNLELDSSSSSKVSVVVYDMLGKLLENREVNASDINGSQIGYNLTTGVYNVVITQDNNTKSLRLIKR